ncbi:MAG TPA: adenine phosphoribosyltransferase [Chloroflexota bacterium]|nr:adenine phosphoribosyltransferase [Chloroflexota bacterium]
MVLTPSELAGRIRDVPDFPIPGIIFRDITTLLKDPEALRSAIDHLTEPFRDRGVDLVVGVESRGFIFAAPIAQTLGAGFIPVRKLGKLPAESVRVEYALEYGSNVLEIHRDAIKPGQRVLIVDDLLATGGTALAAIQLVQKLGGHVVGSAFLVELTFLEGRQRLAGHEITSIISY